MIKRTDYKNPVFQGLLRRKEDAEKAIQQDHSDFVDVYASLDKLSDVVIMYDEEKAIGCAALKPVSKLMAEVGRLFIDENYRGKGLAGSLVQEIEKIAKEKNYECVMAEYWTNNKASARTFEKGGYRTFERIPNPMPAERRDEEKSVYKFLDNSGGKENGL